MFVKDRIWMWLTEQLFAMGPSPRKKKTVNNISHHNKESPAQQRVVEVSLQTVWTKSLEQNNMWTSRYPFQNVQTLARISFIHNGFTGVYSWLVFVSKKCELSFFFFFFSCCSKHHPMRTVFLVLVSCKMTHREIFFLFFFLAVLLSTTFLRNKCSLLVGALSLPIFVAEP